MRRRVGTRKAKARKTKSRSNRYRRRMVRRTRRSRPSRSLQKRYISIGGMISDCNDRVFLVVTHGGRSIPHDGTKDVDEDDKCKIWFPDFAAREKTLLTKIKNKYNPKMLFRSLLSEKNTKEILHYYDSPSLSYDETTARFYMKDLLDQVMGYLYTNDPIIDHGRNNLWESLTPIRNRELVMHDNAQDGYELDIQQPTTESGVENYVLEITRESVKLLSCDRVTELVYGSYCNGTRFDHSRFFSLNNIKEEQRPAFLDTEGIRQSIKHNLTKGTGGGVHITIDYLNDHIKQIDFRDKKNSRLCVICCSHIADNVTLEPYTLHPLE